MYEYLMGLYGGSKVSHFSRIRIKWLTEPLSGSLLSHFCITSRQCRNSGAIAVLVVAKCSTKKKPSCTRLLPSTVNSRSTYMSLEKHYRTFKYNLKINRILCNDGREKYAKIPDLIFPQDV